ncbi:DKNYY family protein [Atlantibacter subterraneus]|uniref:DKNYY family protein n=1 Tax=Atlantibacter subterraneus TaxID=255519 RepID=UPI00289A879C|nr:DKNYY family protein [Atlantibacter subterranea]
MTKKYTLGALILLLCMPYCEAASNWGYSWDGKDGSTIYEGYPDDSSNISQIRFHFADIKQRNLHEAADLSGETEKYFDRDREDENNQSFHWVTDDHFLLWLGKKVINPANTPPVDIITFRAYDRFGVDKDSIYFDGKRTASNTGVDLATLKMNTGRNSTMLTDSSYLYIKGVPQGPGSAHDVTLIGEKSWDLSGKLTKEKRDIASDLIIRFANKIYLNGTALRADANSFQIVRWIPNSLLIYRDKNGTVRYPFGTREANNTTPDCEVPFTVNETSVQWRKTRGEQCQTEVLPGVDPENFHLLTDNIAQYQDRLYVAKLSFFGEEQLDVIKLDTPDLEINSWLSGGKNHGYFIYSGKVRKEVQVFETDGTLHIRDSEPDYDSRYVYTYSYDQLYRKASGCPSQSWFKNNEDIDGTAILMLVDVCK